MCADACVIDKKLVNEDERERESVCVRQRGREGEKERERQRHKETIEGPSIDGIDEPIKIYVCGKIWLELDRVD